MHTSRTSEHVVTHERWSGLGGIRTVVVVIAAMLLCSAAAAGAAQLITGADVKNGSLTGDDIKSGSIPKGDPAEGRSAGAREPRHRRPSDERIQGDR